MAKPITPEEMTAYVEATWNKCQEEAWQEQEPVAWITDGGKGDLGWRKTTEKDIPLYTAPPHKRSIAEDVGRFESGFCG